MDLLEIFVPRGTEFFGESARNFCSPENEISRRISREFLFPGERNFSVNQPVIFVPRGTKFHGGSVGNFRSPGNGIFRLNQPVIFVPRGTKFHGGPVGNFRSPGNEISRWICWKFSFPG